MPQGDERAHCAHCNLIGQLKAIVCAWRMTYQTEWMLGLVQRCSPLVQSSKFLHIYLLSLAVFTQLVFKMPSPTKSSLELPIYPPEYKDLPTELYSMGVPLIAEKIFSLLNPADLCSCLYNMELSGLH